MTYTNETIAKIIQLCENNSKLSKKDQENWWKTASTEEIGNAIIGGYLMTFLAVAEENGIAFDLTYGTMKNFSAGLAALYLKQQKLNYGSKRNAIVVGKTISVYLTLLCVNEEGGRLEYVNGNSTLLTQEAAAELHSRSYAGISVFTGTERIINFFDAGQRCVFGHDREVEGGLFVAMTPAIRAYKRATGVDLAKYGLGDVMIGGMK